MSKPLAVVSGASSGIGAEIAKALSASGFSLLLLARRIKKIQALNLPDTLCTEVDVTDSQGYTEAIHQAEKQFGPVECLVNNAGVMLLGDVTEQNPSEWRNMFEVNVLALLTGMQAVLFKMKQRHTGTIVNISSVAGRKTYPHHAAYSGTKFAVHAISESVREEVADSNVRVITIAPGAVETELLSHTTSDEIKNSYEDWKTAMGGVIHPDDIARAVVFAVSQPQNVCVREIVIAATRQQP